MFQTVLGRIAVRGGMLASVLCFSPCSLMPFKYKTVLPHTKKPMPKGHERTNGAMKLADRHPSIGPWVRDSMKQINDPIISTTLGTSMRFQRCISPSGTDNGPVWGRMIMVTAVESMHKMAITLKNQWYEAFMQRPASTLKYNVHQRGQLVL